MTRVRERIEAWAPWGAGLLLALPIVVLRYPPMGDLASHEAIVAVLRHFGDPRFFPAGLYETSLGQPNQLFHGVAWVLSLALPTDTACKLVVALTVLGICVAAGRLASHFEVTRWSAMLIAPVAIGWMFRWGLVANLIGFALWLATLPALDRLAREPSARRAARAVGLTVVLYFAHESAMVFGAIAALVFVAQAPRKPRELALAASPILAAAALGVLYAVRSEPLKAPSILAVGPMMLSPWEKLLQLPGVLFSGRRAGLGLFAASVVAMMALLSSRRRQRAEPRGTPPDIGATTTARGGSARLCVVALVLFALYWAMPLSLWGSTLIHQRFLAPAFALGVVAVAPRVAPRWAPVLAAFPVLMLAATLGRFLEQDRMYRDLDPVLDRMQDGAAVAQLDLTPREPTRVAPVPGAASRAMAVHGGRLLFSFTDAPAVPVKIPPRYQWNEPTLRIAPAPFAFAPAHDLERFRYALVYEQSRAMDAVLVAAFAPEAHLVTQSGSWLLFESNLPLAPLTSPDEPLPNPPPEPLAARVHKLLAERGAD